jgi:hypothetical protein
MDGDYKWHIVNVNNDEIMLNINFRTVYLIQYHKSYSMPNRQGENFLFPPALPLSIHVSVNEVNCFTVIFNEFKKLKNKQEFLYCLLLDGAIPNLNASRAARYR